MTELTTKEQVLVEFGRVVEPVVSAAAAAESGDPTALLALLEDMGLGEEILGDQYGAVERELRTVSESVGTLQAVLAGEDGLESVEETISEVGQVVDAIDGLSDIETPDADVGDIGDRVFDYLVLRYLRRYHTSVYSSLALMGVVSEPTTATPGALDLSVVGDLLSGPENVPAAVLAWGGDEFLQAILLAALQDLLREQGVLASLEPPDSDDYDALGIGPETHTFGPAERGREVEVLPGEQLRAPLFSLDDGSERVTAGFLVVSLPATEDHVPGLAFVPYGLADSSYSEPLGGGWTFGANFSIVTDRTGFLVRPDDVQLASLSDDGETPVEFHGSAEIVYGESTTGDDRTLVGDPAGSRLAVGSIGAKLGVEFDGDEIVFLVGFPATGVIAVDPEDLGGFLKKVLPADGLNYDFDVTPGWASDAGFYLDTGGTLEIALPQNAELGPITLTEIYLGLTPGGDGFEIVAAVSAKVSLGPVLGTVDRVGISADVAFPESRDGNLGVVDLDLGFEPPSGIGLKIDSGAVTGGGYLRFEPEHNRYAGTLQLQFAKFTVNAIGLLTTELPGGRDGYSLLILITAQDLGVQLGMGFTLDGIGGLLGVHRSMQPKPLRGAVKTGSLDSVLFPEHPVENAQRIISDLRSIFPPTKDQFVIGPMLRVGWGQPTLITADVGVVLQLPRGRVAILGRISADLPDEEVGIVTLNMDALGLILPREKRASLDATIYDSRVVVFALTGGMAMRSAWGDNRRFLLSVGGFHPDFDAPGNFPDIERLKISLSKGAFKLEIKGYFAVTSNTVQMGTNAELWVGKGKWGVRGWLGFDALFRWDPEFKLVADFVAGVEITPIGISLTVEGHLSGPAPWEIRGKIKLKIVLVTIKIPIKATIGPRRDQGGLPEANVLPKLVEALEKPENWEASLPDDEAAVVSLREIETVEGQVLAHPLGTFGVRQQVVPLKGETVVTIDTFGNSRPGDYRQFDITAVRIGDDGDTRLADPPRLTEPFAPAQFLELSNSEKLKRDGYEPMTAGRLIGTQEPVVAGGATFADATRVTTLAYETSVIDEDEDNYGTALAELGIFATIPGPDTARFGISPKMTDVILNGGAVALGEMRTTGLSAFNPEDVITDDGDDGAQDPAADLSVPLGTADRGYVISRKDELTQVDLGDAAPRMTRTEAEQVLERHLEANPEDEVSYQVVAAHTVAGTGGGIDG